MTNGSLLKVESIAEWPASSNNWSWKPIFGLFESRCFTQVVLYYKQYEPHPEFFVRGVQARQPENSMDNGVFFVFLVLNLLGVQWFYIRENYTFPRIQRGSNIFQGGGGGGGG